MLILGGDDVNYYVFYFIVRFVLVFFCLGFLEIICGYCLLVALRFEASYCTKVKRNNWVEIRLT